MQERRMFLMEQHSKPPENAARNQFGLWQDANWTQFNRVQEIYELKIPPGNRLEQ